MLYFRRNGCSRMYVCLDSIHATVSKTEVQIVENCPLYFSSLLCSLTEQVFGLKWSTQNLTQQTKRETELSSDLMFLKFIAYNAYNDMSSFRVYVLKDSKPTKREYRAQSHNQLLCMMGLLLAFAQSALDVKHVKHTPLQCPHRPTSSFFSDYSVKEINLDTTRLFYLLIQI